MNYVQTGFGENYKKIARRTPIESQAGNSFLTLSPLNNQSLISSLINNISTTILNLQISKEKNSSLISAKGRHLKPNQKYKKTLKIS
jgi:hypothetical protein